MNQTSESVSNITQLVMNETTEYDFVESATENSMHRVWGSNAGAEYGPIVEPKDSFTESLQNHLREMQIKFANFTESWATSEMMNERDDTEESDNMTMPVAICTTMAGKKLDMEMR